MRESKLIDLKTDRGERWCPCLVLGENDQDIYRCSPVKMKIPVVWGRHHQQEAAMYLKSRGEGCVDCVLCAVCVPVQTGEAGPSHWGNGTWDLPHIPGRAIFGF